MLLLYQEAASALWESNLGEGIEAIAEGRCGWPKEPIMKPEEVSK